MIAVLGVAAALALLGGALGDWFVVTSTRDVAGVEVIEQVGTAAPTSWPAWAGFLGLVFAPLLAPRRTRRIAAILVIATGAVGVVTVILAVMGPTSGEMTSGPALAAVGGAGLVAAGVLASRAHERRADAAASTIARADARLDGRADTDEWDLV